MVAICRGRWTGSIIDDIIAESGIRDLRRLTRVLTDIGRSAALSSRFQARYLLGGRPSFPTVSARRLWTAIASSDAEQFVRVMEGESKMDCAEFAALAALAIMPPPWSEGVSRALESNLDTLSTGTIEWLLTSGVESGYLGKLAGDGGGIVGGTLAALGAAPCLEGLWANVGATPDPLFAGDLVVGWTGEGTLHAEFVLNADTVELRGSIPSMGLRGASPQGVALLNPAAAELVLRFLPGD